MSIVPLVRPLEPCEGTPASFRLAHEVFALAFRLIEGFAREARVRRDMKRLAEVDDDMLRDIGIARSDIEGAVRHSRDAQS